MTGAIILVVLVVVLVPELLSGPGSRPPEPPGGASEAPLRSYTIDLTDEAGKSPLQPAAVYTPAAPVASAEAVSDAEEKRPAASAPEPTVAKELAATAREPETPVTEAPAASGSERRPGTAAPQPRRSPDAGWTVQVGSFVSRSNADRLARELAKLGYPAFVTEGTSNGRTLYRVRVGPEEDRDAAQALADRLRKSGRTGTLVPPT